MPAFHLVAHARGWLYTRDSEAQHLWASLGRAFPEALACCLMPDHAHLLLPHEDAAGRFYRVRAGYSRWLASQPRWPERFAWASMAKPEPLAPDPGHLRRTIRYIQLNPCRGGLARDPLVWLWSTHRDAVGFALRPWLRAPDPDRFHAYDSGDPTVSITGTSLPRVRDGSFDLAGVSRAVSSICRIAAPETVYGRPRALALKTAHAFGHDDTATLARWAGCSVRNVQYAVDEALTRWVEPDDEVLYACIRAVGDPRFEGPLPGDLSRTHAWQAYRRAREARASAARLLNG